MHASGRSNSLQESNNASVTSCKEQQEFLTVNVYYVLLWALGPTALLV